MTDSKEQLHGTITARAELDRAFARLIIEDVTSVTAKNISTVLRMMEEQHGEVMEAVAGASTDIKKLASDILVLSRRIGGVESRMNESEADRADLRSRLERIEQILAERPEQRAAEHQALIRAIRGDGDAK